MTKERAKRYRRLADEADRWAAEVPWGYARCLRVGGNAMANTCRSNRIEHQISKILTRGAQGGQTPDGTKTFLYPYEAP